MFGAIRMRMRQVHRFRIRGAWEAPHRRANDKPGSLVEARRPSEQDSITNQPVACWIVSLASKSSHHVGARSSNRVGGSESSRSIRIFFIASALLAPVATN